MQKNLDGDCKDGCRVVKMKEHLLFCREFSTLCIKDRVIVDHVV